jgi:GntR family transcriptional repressor for pyruvate dehydrogenase complex
MAGRTALSVSAVPGGGGAPPRAQRRRLHDDVTRQLADWIVAERLAPGAPLPPEGELAARFGVSRATIREAVKVLAARGLIDVRHGIGLFVGDATARPLTDALSLLLQRQHVDPEALLEARLLLEVEIAGLAAQRATEEDLAAMERALAGLGRADQPLEAQMAADAEFHLALARASHNPVFAAVSEAVRQPLVESMRATYPLDGGPARRYREHAAVYAAVRARRPAAARAAMLLMLETSADAIRRARSRHQPGSAAGVPAAGEALAGPGPSPAPVTWGGRIAAGDARSSNEAPLPAE